MPRWLKISVLAVAFLLLAAIPLARQFETGSIEGMITDTNGPLANASVEARSLLTGAVVNEQSDASGQYFLQHLQPGPYSLWIEARGHDSLWISRVVVEAHQTTRQDAYLNQSNPRYWGSTPNLSRFSPVRNRARHPKHLVR